MRTLPRLLLTIFIAIIVNGCAISNTYGPYMGKVIEKETGEPVDGAVVFLRFHTTSGTIAGSVSHYVDAFETMTDRNGDFIIHPYKVNTFRFMQGWDKEVSAIIFKPGYGAFPRHKGTTETHPNGTLPENKETIIELPKLQTKDERRKNLRNLAYGSPDIPQEKQIKIMELKEKERAFVGLSIQ